MRRIRIICKLLVMVLVASDAISFGTADSFAASGKKKTVYVPTRITTVFSGGPTYSKTIKYNKKGLPKKMIFGNNKMVLIDCLKRNRCGEEAKTSSPFFNSRMPRSRNDQ